MKTVSKIMVFFCYAMIIIFYLCGRLASDTLWLAMLVYWVWLNLTDKIEG